VFNSEYDAMLYRLQDIDNLLVANC